MDRNSWVSWSWNCVFAWFHITIDYVRFLPLVSNACVHKCVDCVYSSQVHTESTVQWFGVSDWMSVIFLFYGVNVWVCICICVYCSRKLYGVHMFIVFDCYKREHKWTVISPMLLLLFFNSSSIRCFFFNSFSSSSSSHCYCYCSVQFNKGFVRACAFFMIVFLWINEII